MQVASQSTLWSALTAALLLCKKTFKCKALSKQQHLNSKKQVGIGF